MSVTESGERLLEATVLNAAPESSTNCLDLRVRRIATDSDLTAIADAWNCLADDVPFRRWEWLEAWWRHFATERDDLFVLAVYDTNEQLVGLAPWYRHRSPWLGDVLRFLGSGIVCSDYLTILAQPNRAADVNRAILAWLHHDGRKYWDALELEAVDQTDVGSRDFVDQCSAREHTFHERPALNCWRLELPTNWDAYVKTLSSTRRNMVRKIVKRFDSGDTVLRWASNRDELEQGWNILVDLHQRRRKMLNQPGCFASERFHDFLRLVAERFLDLGRLRLQWIEIEGQPIAIELDLAGGNTVYMYQSGIEPNAMSRQPGWLGTIGALRRATLDGFQYFDFLRGDEPYKGSWRATPQPLVDVRIVARGRRAQCRHAMWLTVQQAKGLAKAALRRQSGGQSDAAFGSSESVEKTPATA